LNAAAVTLALRLKVWILVNISRIQPSYRTFSWSAYASSFASGSSNLSLSVLRKPVIELKCASLSVRLFQWIVRSSPLAVILGLADSRTAHTMPRLASTLPSNKPLSRGSYQSREEPEVVSESEPRTSRGFFHFPETKRDMLVSKHGSC
jgi:hypothetical protein